MSDEPVLVSFSELNKGRECPHEWDLAYRQRWVSDRITPPLAIGKLWHAVLEAHYRELARDHTARGGRAAAHAAREVWTQAREGGSPYAPTVEFMYRRYLDKWGYDQQWKIVAVEHELVAPLPWPGYGPHFTLKGRIDLIIRAQGRLQIVDHKSHRNLPSEYDLAFDDQFGIYEALMLALGKEVFGCLYNATRYFIPKSEIWENLDDYLLREPLYRTKDELADIVRDAARDFATLYGYEPGDAPRHTDRRKCKGCFFNAPCLSGRKRGQAHEIDHLLSRGWRQDRTRH